MSKQTKKLEYFLRKEDLIPFKGVKEYSERNISNSNYEIDANVRKVILRLYNAAIIGISVGTITGGLARLLIDYSIVNK